MAQIETLPNIEITKPNRKIVTKNEDKITAAKADKLLAPATGDATIDKSNKSEIKNSPSNIKSIFKKNLLKEFKGLDKSQGGWGSSGGGSGVACFATANDAVQADAFIDNQKTIPQPLKSKIKTLVTLDYWEWDQFPNHPELISPKTKEYKKILQDIKSYMAFMTPLYIFRLQQVSQLIEPVNWISKESIPRIYDAQPKSKLPENCRLVQLVARYTKDKYTIGTGPAKNLPVVKIEADEDLFLRLDPLNQAVLVLHEQMYLLGQIIGHTTSDPIRNLIMEFFTSEISKKPFNSPISRALRQRLVYYFGDYMMYFGLDKKVSPPPGSQDSRFASFYTMLDTIRSADHECSKDLSNDLKSDAVRQARMRCKDFSMNPARNEIWMTDEMAFLFVSYFFLDVSANQINAEVLLAPVSTDELKAVSQKTIAISCQWIYENESQLRFKILTQKAKAYCDLIQR